MISERQTILVLVAQYSNQVCLWQYSCRETHKYCTARLAPKLFDAPKPHVANHRKVFQVVRPDPLAKAIYLSQPQQKSLHIPFFPAHDITWIPLGVARRFGCDNPGRSVRVGADCTVAPSQISIHIQRSDWMTPCSRGLVSSPDQVVLV